MTQHKLPRHRFNLNDVDVKSHDTLYSGFVKLCQLQLRFKQFAGGVSSWVSREVSERPMVSAVLPYDPIQQTVVLIEQVRVGAYCGQHNPWLFELVAGLIDDGEEPLITAKRELAEEAGLDTDQLYPVTTYWASPGSSTERVHVFCAKVDSRQSGTVCGVDHEDEDIYVHVVPVDTAFAMLESGDVDNAPTVIALQWLKLNKAELDQKWT